MSNYDIAIIGAGVAGSSLAILLADAGYNVVVFEKESYPSHKVCGEFISLESYEFLKSLGLPLDDWNLPIIKDLMLTSQMGTISKSKLKMGGFGLSRYKLDYELSKQMIKSGVDFFPNSKVTLVDENKVITRNKEVTANQIIGSHGKYSAGYLKSQKSAKPKPIRNFLGVKYHIKGNFQDDLISLHSFRGGYCGISKIEDDLFCLCYLIDSQRLKESRNSIPVMEEKILFKNPHLKDIFSKAEFVWEEPLIISNVKFSKQSLANNDVILVGDSAGSISPLSGNGMSIAAKSALVLFELISKEYEANELLSRYNKQWNKNFGKRVKRAKYLNSIMLNPASNDFVLKLFNFIPAVKNLVVNDMQGDKFVRNTNLYVK